MTGDHVCNECDETFSTRASLNGHMSSHGNGKDIASSLEEVDPEEVDLDG